MRISKKVNIRLLLIIALFFILTACSQTPDKTIATQNIAVTPSAETVTKNVSTDSVNYDKFNIQGIALLKNEEIDSVTFLESNEITLEKTYIVRTVVNSESKIYKAYLATELEESVLQINPKLLMLGEEPYFAIDDVNADGFNEIVSVETKFKSKEGQITYLNIYKVIDDNFEIVFSDKSGIDFDCNSGEPFIKVVYSQNDLNFKFIVYDDYTLPEFAEGKFPTVKEEYILNQQFQKEIPLNY